MILQEVQNFDNYPDGRLRAGPFPGAPDQIARHLERHDLHIGALGEKGMCSRTIMGTMISAAGAGVNGYLLDGEGLEAASSDQAEASTFESWSSTLQEEWAGWPQANWRGISPNFHTY